MLKELFTVIIAPVIRCIAIELFAYWLDKKNDD